VDVAADCTLSGGSSSPYFIPKVSDVSLEYNQLLCISFGTLVCFYFFISFFFFFLSFIMYS
jgi:hypothetical protein